MPGNDAAATAPFARLARRAGAGLLRFALPPHCLACTAPVASEGGLCAACWSKFRLIEQPFCDVLAIPFAYDAGDGALSPEAIASPPPFARMRAVAVFDDVARQLVHGLKYHDHLDLARWMGAWMARAGSDILDAAEVVVPVPLHHGRLWQRKFNQAAALAQIVARTADRDYRPLALQRVRATRRQVGLGGRERIANMRGAFRVHPKRTADVAGRAVVLVDDVYTTGSTAGAATRALLRAGAARVDVLVFARVARGPD